MTESKLVSILGCGWLGLPLAQKFSENGYRVKGSTTRSEKFGMLQEVGVDPFLIELGKSVDPVTWDDFLDADFVVVNFPPQLRSGGSLELFTTQMNELIAELERRPPREFLIFISSTSVYGIEQGDVNEATEPVPTNLSGQAILAAERALQEAFSNNVTIVRPGGLVGPGRFPGRFLSGEVNVRDGDAPVNLIHLDDCVGVISQLVEKRMKGKIVNLVAPETQSRRDFYPQMAVKLGVEAPLFLKSGMEQKKNYKRVESQFLQKELNYHFKYPRIWEMNPE